MFGMTSAKVKCIFGLILVLGACGPGGSRAEADYDEEDKTHGQEDDEESVLFHGRQDDEAISTEKLTSYQRIYVNNVMVLLNEIEDNYGEAAETSLAARSETENDSESSSDDATVNDEPELLSVNGYDSKSGRISVHRLDQLQYECDIPNDMLERSEFKWKLNGVVVAEKDPSFSPSIGDYASANERADLNVSCIFKLNRIEKPIELKFPLVHLGKSSNDCALLSRLLLVANLIVELSRKLQVSELATKFILLQAKIQEVIRRAQNPLGHIRRRGCCFLCRLHAVQETPGQEANRTRKRREFSALPQNLTCA